MQLVLTPAASSAAQCVASQRRGAPRPQAFKAATPRRVHRAQLQRRAVAEQQQSASVETVQPQASDNFVPVLLPEELPKGTRKEVRVQGKSVLLFWYRNQIYAIEARSPAEGAYSEGFDYCIECPSTGTLFSLKDGSIASWYPTNPVLRLLTPQDTCRNLEIYPVRLQQNAIEVDVSGSSTRGGGAVTRGGSDTSLENNNVFGLEPRAYVEGTPEAADPASGDLAARAATATVALLAVGGLVVAGTAAVIYFFFI
eukprot:scaffold3.g6307.t1